MDQLIITGGAGFIGSSLAERVLDQSPNTRVLVIDSLTPFYNPNWKSKFLDSILKKGQGRSRFIQADIAGGHEGWLPDVEKWIGNSGSKQTVFVHLAANAGVRPSVANPGEYARANAVGTMQALEGCRRLGIDLFVNASSSSVYGRTSRVPFSEDAPVGDPQSPYAATKLAGELFCQNYSILHKIKCVSLRFFTVYGPRQRPDLAIHGFTRKIDLGQTLIVYGDGSTSRDYTFIDDILDGVVSAVEWLKSLGCGGRHERINLGSSQPIALHKLISEIETRVGKKANLDFTPIPEEDLLVTFANVEKAKKLLGYEPRVTLEKGLDQFMNWYRQWYSQN